MATDQLNLAVFVVDPEDTTDIDIQLLTSDGDTWAGSGSIVFDPTGELRSPKSTQITGAMAKVWLSGGVAGKRYFVIVPVTSTQGRTKQVKFFVDVRRT